MMTLDEAVKTLDEVIPHPSNDMVDMEHLSIAIAWKTVKEAIRKEHSHD